MTRRFTIVAAALVALAGPPVRAQEPSPDQQRSPIEELVARARAALNDLEYARADSIARTLLDLRGQATAAQRIEGLQLLVAALYPDEPRAQRRDSAVRYLEELVRATPNHRIPRAISWPGLDALQDSVRDATFALWLEVDPDTLDGPGAALRLRVSASRPARFGLTAAPAVGGDPITLDSSAGLEAVLAVRVLEGDTVRLPGGVYEMRVTAIDAGGERADRRLLARVEAPPLGLAAIPVAPDAARFLPERARPRPLRNAIIGVALGAATVATANVFRGSPPLDAVGSDGRAFAMAGAITVGAIVGALIDPGAPLPRNVAHNARVRTEYAERVAQLERDNARRRATYRARIEILAGVEP